MDLQLIDITHHIVDGIEDRASFFTSSFQRVLIVYDALDPDFFMTTMHEKIKNMYILRQAKIDWIMIEPLQNTIKISPQQRDYDLIITTPFLHRVIDVPGALIQMKALLSSRGVLISPIIGHTSFEPLKQMLTVLDLEFLNGIQQRFFPMISMKDAGRLLIRAGFDSCVSDFIRLNLSFDSFRDLKQALQLCHENYTYRQECYLSQSSSQKLFSRTHIEKINTNLKKIASNNQIFMDAIYIIGWLNPIQIPSPSSFECGGKEE